MRIRLNPLIIVVLSVVFAAVLAAYDNSGISPKTDDNKNIQQKNNEIQQPQEVSMHITRAFLGNAELALEIADTLKERQRGLSGRKQLPSNSGLLFIFGESGQHGIWMKDMLFPIDIVWLDEDYRTVHIEQDVSPDTFPEIFKPNEDKPALYVLEVNAGFTSEYDIQIGDKLTFARETSE